MGVRRVLLVTAAASSTLAVGGWPATSAAQEAPATAFANGTAKATASVGKVAPGVGSLELALGTGTAVAEIRNDLAQAQSRAADLGLIGTTLTAEGCDGGAAAVTPDQLPQPIRADNRKGDATATEDEAPVAGGTFGGGRMEVEATEEPSATATTTALPLEIPPVIAVEGGRAQAVTRIVDGVAREAVATSEASVDIAGIVQLGGMRWQALHRTGADPAAVGTFVIGSAVGADSPLSVDQAAALEAPINQLLAPTGITVDMPEVIRLEEPADLVRVTPLRIVLKDSPIGGTVLGPALDVTREQRLQLFDQLAAAFCQSAGALLVGDVGVTIAAGAGFLALEIGGAEATTADVVFEDPFGADAGAAGSTPALPASGAPAPSAGGGVPTAPVGGGGATPAAPTTGGSRPFATISGDIEKLCESVNPVDWPPCSRGAALPLGLLGLGLAGGMATLDWRFQLRRQNAVVT